MYLTLFFTKLLIIFMILGGQLQATHIGLITSSEYVGDREVAWRIKVAGERLGWKVSVDEADGTQLKYQNLDWVICMLPYNYVSNTPCPNYLMVFHPFNYLDEQRKFKPFYEKYDGYLLTINDRSTLRRGLKQVNKDFHYTRFYPTVYSIPYKELTLNNLVVMIPVWGNRLTDSRFKTLYKLLSQSGFAKFYGVCSNENINPQNYMGPIPFNGISVIDILQKHGIVLVFHSEIHNQERIPSSRIFDAAAASAVIISDESAFVKEHFGDSVFYIDTSVSGEIIFKQIQEHLNAISQDPEKALDMAKKAHEIFNEKFTMENQLLQVQSMHRKVISKKIEGKYE